MPRSIIFLTRLYAPHIGGVETHVRELAKELLQRGYAVAIITEQFDSALPLKEIINGATVVRIPKEMTGEKLPVWRWMLAHADIFVSADIIHAHDVFWWYLPLRFMLKIPVYTTFHGWEGVFPPQQKAILWRKLAETLSKNTVCVGEYIKKWYGTKKCMLTYGATTQRLLPPGNKDTIAFLGRLEKENDIEDYLRVFSLLKLRFPELNITFIGDGTYAGEARRLGKVTGFTKNTEAYLRTARWVWSASYLSILAAMAAGKIVCALYGNELKKDYLELFPGRTYMLLAGSLENFTAQFADVYQDSEKQRTIRLGAQTWAKAQTWEKLANQYENLWEFRSS